MHVSYAYRATKREARLLLYRGRCYNRLYHAMLRENKDEFYLPLPGGGRR